MSLPTLALCLEYPLALRGGVSVLVEELIHGLAADFRIVLVSPDEREALAERPVAPLIAAHIVWAPSRPTAASARALAERLRDEKCAIAHFHIGGVYGWGIRRPGGSPFGFVADQGIAVCSTVHLTVSPLDGFCGPAKPLWFKVAMFPIAWLGKMAALGRVQTEIAVSRHDEAKLRRWFAPMAGRFRQIYHSRLRVSPEPQPDKRRATILNVGHVAHRKGQHVLATAFAQVARRYPQWELEFVGPHEDASAVARVREIVGSAGLSQRVHLRESRDDVQGLMQHAGIYVQPSIHEALGLALQEALFAGCPAIGTTAGGIPELIRDGDNGLLVKKNDVGALAVTLERLMSDAALRERFSKRARPSIIERGMIAGTMIQRHAELYQKILNATR